MYFDDLKSRLLVALRVRLQSGELTERRLARLTGVSQPHMHNVLKGIRILSPEIGDLILHRLKISVVDLFTPDELQKALGAARWKQAGYAEIPVFEGWLGPGLPLPRTVSSIERHPFPGHYLASLEFPVVARLAPDPRMALTLCENDLVLLDHTPRKRIHPDSSGLYVLNRHGEGLVRRVRRVGPQLHLLADDTRPTDVISLSGKHLLDIVRARIAWIGRRLQAEKWGQPPISHP